MVDCIVRSWLFAALLIVLGSFSPQLLHAQYAPAAPASASSQLGDPHVRAAAVPPLQLDDPADLELSQRSQGGPGTEVVAGGLLILWTPIIAGIVALAAGPDWFECGWDEEEEYGQSECEARVAREEQSAARKAIAVGLITGTIGISLVGHGAYRIRRIRQARKHVELSAASLSIMPGGATLGLSAAF
jgi:hypothetical protein